MPRVKTIPPNPRFDYVTEKAYSYLVEWGYSSLPISPWDVLDEFSGRIVCLKLSEANAIVENSKLGSLFKNKEEGACFKIRGDSTSVIVYDDINIHNENRIRWTIMHELGHILLGHLDDFPNTGLNRGGLTETEYGTLEVEAHCFAAEVLAPTAVMLRFAGITSDHIRAICGLSDKAAVKRYSSLFENSYHPSTRYDQKILRNFSSFMRWDVQAALYEGCQRIIGETGYVNLTKLSRKCPRCYSFTTDPNAQYCIYCGERFVEPKWGWAGGWYGQDDELLRKHKSRRRFSYENVRKNADWEHDKFQQCPVCQNEEISIFADYCSICGQPLRNMCIAEDKAVSIKARYCPDCGSETTFKKSYDAYEVQQERLNRIEVPEDWLEYDYWDYIIGAVGRNRDLTAALKNARAFTDDFDKVYIIASGHRFAEIIKSMEEAIRMLMKQSDGISYEKVEVYTI